MRANAELKEMLEARDKTIAKLHMELNKRKRPPLNKECSKAVHQVTKKLKENDNVTFDFNTSASHPHNAQVMNRIVEGAMRTTSSSKYSKEDAEESTKRYFKNLKDEHMRGVKGTKEKHLRCMRRNSRMDQKLKMRRSGLKSKYCKLSPSQKQMAKEIMHMEYMSSDEVEKVDGKEYRNVRLIRWESSEARHIKSVLLETHIQQVLGERDRKKMHYLRRDENCSLSERKRPDDAPVWAYLQ